MKVGDREFSPPEIHGKADALVFDADGNGPLPGPGEPQVETPIVISTMQTPVADGWRLGVAVEPYLGAYTDLAGAKALREALDKAIARIEGSAKKGGDS